MKNEFEIEYIETEIIGDVMIVKYNITFPQGIDFIPIDIKIASAQDVDLDKALGTDLDRLAEIWGMARNPNESDEALSHRIRGSAVDDGITTLTGDVGCQPSSNHITIKKKKCECGAASLGHTQPGQGHAHYCPLRT